MASFKVTSVNERTTVNPAGALVKEVVITLSTTLGAAGQVEIPSERYMLLTESDEGRRALAEQLGAKADQLDAPFMM
jgi:hypothetical protein